MNTSGAPSFGFGVDTEPILALQPARPPRGPLARRARRGRRSTPAPPQARTSRSARRSAIVDAPAQAVRGRRHRASTANVESLGGATFADLRRRDRAAAASTARAVRRDLDRRRGGNVAADELVADIQPLLPDDAEVQTGVEQATGRRGRVGEFAAFFRYFLLAFAGDRALRRRVRHLQHALDHGRAADARVRDAPHARRLAPSGAPLRAARGVRDRASSRRSSGSRSASRSPRGCRRCSARSGSGFRRRGRCTRRGRSSSRSSSGRS